MELEERTFYSSEKEPDNAAFHVNVYPTDKHPPSGLWSMSPCLQFGVEGSAPLFVSQPFFGEAADEVKDGVIFEGDIEPNLKIHLHIDPVSHSDISINLLVGCVFRNRPLINH